ncbi:DUF3019 domain-containing protein [Thalassotalea euphylliae]|uniref:DUF3019 domain-containing protein n=1 Tax=Thalassotalea euphylliae TaxID=1655234 RepID=UPI003624BF00
MKRLLLALFAVFSMPSLLHAQQTEAPSQASLTMKQPILTASPNVCELEKDSYLCEVKAALIWEMPVAGHYCLYEAEETVPLQCWDNNWSGSHVLTFQSDKPITYVLKPFGDNTVVIEATVNVIGTLEQRIRAKRRRRFLRFF